MQSTIRCQSLDGSSRWAHAQTGMSLPDLELLATHHSTEVATTTTHTPLFEDVTESSRWTYTFQDGQ